MVHKATPSIKRVIVSAGMVLVASIFSVLVGTEPVSAASPSDFDPGRIIGDGQFTNKSAMNIGDIQNLLNAKMPNCDTNGDQLIYDPTHGDTVPRRVYGERRGNPAPYTCLKDFSENGKSAAQIIWEAAQDYSISPRVLVVTLQKEQALVTDPWPWAVQYRSAMGFACPDGSPCDPGSGGFTTQVREGARHFRGFFDNSLPFVPYTPGSRYVQYNPNSGCGGTTITIANRATAALYSYTPYQPNPAAMSNLYGTGDRCSAYGNRNFWRDYTDWFGPTLSGGFVLAKSDDPSDLKQYVIYGSIKQHVPNSDVLYAWGLDSVPLVTMPKATIDSYSTGPNLDRLMRLSYGQSYYFLDNGKKYKVSPANSDLISTWKLSGMVNSSVTVDLYSVPTYGGVLNFSVKNPENDTIYLMDGLNDSNQTVLRPFSSTTAFKAWEGESASAIAISSGYFDRIDNAVGSSISHTKVSINGTEFQIAAGKRYSQPYAVASLFPGVAKSISSTTFNRMSNGGAANFIVRAKNSPAVYMLDAGEKHHLLGSAHLNSWLPAGKSVSVMSDSYVSLIPSGDDISELVASSSGQSYIMKSTKLAVPSELGDAFSNALSAYSASSALVNQYQDSGLSLSGFIKGKSSPNVYFLDNSGMKRRLESPNKLYVWAGQNPNVTELEDYLVNSIEEASGSNIYVSDGENEYVMENGKKVVISSGAQSAWNLSSPLELSDGTLDRFETGTEIGAEAKDGGFYYLIRDGKAFITVDPNIASTWSIQDSPGRSARTIRQLLPVAALTRFVESPDDGKKYVVEKGNWYELSNQQRSNLGSDSERTMSLAASWAPNSISDWEAVVVKDTAGTHYAIDGGRKRRLSHPTILSQWTGSGVMEVVTTNNGFLNLLPTSGNVERTVKGPGPEIYSVENGTKRHILSPAAYHTQHAPYSSVSQQLLDVLEDGEDIR